MAHTSPAVNLIWAFLAIILGVFLVYHLWSFDRFRCLRWNHGPYAGAFKRLMTYAYLLSVPLLIVYAVGFAVLKYNYGFSVVPGLGIIPTPYQEWSPIAQNAVFPLYLSFSAAWGLELLTHLEELCFWLFLVNSRSAQQDWFQSLYFKTWAVGSGIAMVAMPLITILTRGDVYKCEAYTFLVGGLASVSLTIWFLPVLWTFPSFLDNLKDNRVETNTLVRLTTYHELNCIRVIFRFLFTVPFIILGVDGVRPHQHVNDKMFPTDFLAIIAGIGCVVSSGITLVIFFPRSIQGEMAFKEQRRTLLGRSRQRTDTNMTMVEARDSRSLSLDVGPVKWTEAEAENTAMDATKSILGMRIPVTRSPQCHGRGIGNEICDANPRALLHEDDKDGYVPTVPSHYEVGAGRERGSGRRRDPHSDPRHQRQNHNQSVARLLPLKVKVKTRSTSTSLDMAAVDVDRVRGWRQDVELGFERDRYGNMDDGSMGSNGSSVVLKPNRLNRTGDVELGEVAACAADSVPVITSSPVSTFTTPAGSRTESTFGFAPMRRRERSGVSNLVHQWRSPIEIGRPTGARWPRQL